MSPAGPEEVLLDAGECGGSYVAATRRLGSFVMCGSCGRTFHYRRLPTADGRPLIPLHKKPPAEAA